MAAVLLARLAFSSSRSLVTHPLVVRSAKPMLFAMVRLRFIPSQAFGGPQMSAKTLSSAPIRPYVLVATKKIHLENVSPVIRDSFVVIASLIILRVSNLNARCVQRELEIWSKL